MKIVFKSFLILFFLSLGILTFVSNYLGTVVSASASAAGAPWQVYARNCARCHGADGKGNTELGRLNDVPDLTTAHVKGRSVKSLENVIRNGEGSMPAFGKKIAAKDITALAQYVRGL